MILSAMISLDMIGQITSFGGQTFTWLLVFAALWMIPYGLITAELGSAFPSEGGLYEWVSLAFGRLAGNVATMMYWSINPTWMGGSLAFISAQCWSNYIYPMAVGSPGDYGFKAIFIVFCYAITAMPLERSRIVFRIGTYMKLLLTIMFLITTVAYGLKFGFKGIGVSGMAPTLAGGLGLAPLLLFSFVGFEVPSQAGDEMRDPQRDVPRGIAVSGLVSLLAYALPILALLLVLPSSAITGISGFMAAVETVFDIYGPASRFLLFVAAMAFITSLAVTAAAWATGANRALAVAAADGAFYSCFAKINVRRQTPERVSFLGAAMALVFMVAGTIFSAGNSASAFAVVLSIATSTSMLSLLFVFPAAYRLRLTHPQTPRPYTVPGGLLGMGIAATITTMWMTLGSLAAIFPGMLEVWFGLEYPFVEHWGVTRVRFEIFALATLAVLLAIGIIGFMRGQHFSQRKP
jgi:amino acid transporter